MPRIHTLTTAVNKHMHIITHVIHHRLSTLSFVDVDVRKSSNMNRSEQLNRATIWATRKKSKKNNVAANSQIRVSFVGTT